MRTVAVRGRPDFPPIDEPRVGPSMVMGCRSSSSGSSASAWSGDAIRGDRAARARRPDPALPATNAAALSPDGVRLRLPRRAPGRHRARRQRRPVADLGMKRLMRMALRLYPDAWRRRYGPEVGQLIDDASSRPADLLDLVSHAPVVVTFRGAASTMNERLAAHPVRLALIALAITLPTAFFVAVAVLKYILGVPAPSTLSSRP